MWKKVVSFEGLYSVSDLGEIRNDKTNKILKQNKRKNGYMQVAIKVGGRSGTTVCFKMHREVAKAFIPNPLNLPYVNHIDGDKGNNSVSNLEWVTASENMQHAYDTGLKTKEQLAQRKLSAADVDFIRNNYVPRSREFGTRALGKQFGIHHTTVQSILSNETYV